MKTRDSLIYVGRLEGDRPAVYITGKTTVERFDSVRPSLEWGVDAPDAGLALARALLTDASGSEPPADICCRFAEQVIRRLPSDGFALPQDTVNAWLRRIVTV